MVGPWLSEPRIQDTLASSWWLVVEGVWQDADIQTQSVSTTTTSMPSLSSGAKSFQNTAMAFCFQSWVLSSYRGWLMMVLMWVAGVRFFDHLLNGDEDAYYSFALLLLMHYMLKNRQKVGDCLFIILLFLFKILPMCSFLNILNEFNVFHWISMSFSLDFSQFPVFLSSSLILKFDIN